MAPIPTGSGKKYSILTNRWSPRSPSLQVQSGQMQPHTTAGTAPRHRTRMSQRPAPSLGAANRLSTVPPFCFNWRQPALPKEYMQKVKLSLDQRVKPVWMHTQHKPTKAQDKLVITCRRGPCLRRHSVWALPDVITCILDSRKQKHASQPTAL